VKHALPLLFVLLPILPGCLGEPECSNEVSRVLMSPDGSKKLVVFSRDCGATTGFNTQLSLLGAGDGLPDESGNVLVADQVDLKVAWESDQRVAVSLRSSVQVYKKKTEFGGVSFGYRE
jgi:hypothetical protein